MPPKTVRILGSALNARELPDDEPGVELWCANGPFSSVALRCKKALGYWDRWFNLHSRKHILGTYPSGWSYYKDKADGRPIYLLKAQPDIPTSIAFPYKAILAAFATARGPNRYFTCTVCWLIAFAVLEGFERIELWGFELRDTKPGSVFAFERPCFAYWVKVARDRGIEVVYQGAITRLYEAGKMVPGDPDAYSSLSGLLYGYSTKADVGWCLIHDEFGCCATPT